MQAIIGSQRPSHSYADAKGTVEVKFSKVFITQHGPQLRFYLPTQLIQPMATDNHNPIPQLSMIYWLPRRRREYLQKWDVKKTQTPFIYYINVSSVCLQASCTILFSSPQVHPQQEHLQNQPEAVGEKCATYEIGDYV